MLKFQVLVSLFVALSAASAPAQSPAFRFLQKPGDYPVGLKVIEQYDRTRSFPAGSEAYRPLQTLIWYPAVKSMNKPMTVGNYVSLADEEIHFNAPDEKQNKWRPRFRAVFDIPLWAVRNAAPAEGRYPVVIYAPSDSATAWENADLCEYLASHGYVVLASPSMGASTRDMTDDTEGINAEARDISFLVTYASELPQADVSEVAVVSWSWGGISSLFAAARDPRIHALAELDGSMRYFPGLVQKAGDVHPNEMKIPLLFFAANSSMLMEALDSYYDGPPSDIVGPSVLNAWRQADLFSVKMLGMSHPEFCSMCQRRKTAEDYAEDEVADYGRDDTNTGYAWVARYTLEFLDGYLKNDASAKAFLVRNPAENGVPRHTMGITFRAAGTPGKEPTR